MSKKLPMWQWQGERIHKFGSALILWLLCNNAILLCNK